MEMNVANAAQHKMFPAGSQVKWMKKADLVTYLRIKQMQEIVDNAVSVTPKKATEFGIRLFNRSYQ